MSDDTDPRLVAARACQAIIEVARRDPDIRVAVAKICSSRGVGSIFDLAEESPDDVVMLAEAFTDLDREAPL